MRQSILLIALLFIVGCGVEQVNDPIEPGKPLDPVASAEVTAGYDASTKPPKEKKTVASNAKLPFDMPIMPEARYLSGMKFSKPTKRRGPEAIATIIAKGTTLEVVEYYEKALADNGFTPTVGRNNSESTATVRGVRENGETFSVTSMSGGSKAGEGECQTAIVATKPKPKDGE